MVTVREKVGGTRGTRRFLYGPENVHDREDDLGRMEAEVYQVRKERKSGNESPKTTRE